MTMLEDIRAAITSEVIDVGPQQAAKWLERNVNNRPLNPERVKNLAAAIARGEWVFNGDSIKLSATGRLLDGQHRLSAIVESLKPCRTLVVRGLPDEVFTAIDTNRKPRSAADVLGLEGVPNRTTHAALARLVWRKEAHGHPFSNNFQPTVEQVNAVALARPGLREATSFATSRDFLKRHLTPGPAAFCVYEFARFAPDKVYPFFDSLCTGADLSPGSPVLLLRERLMANAGHSGKAKHSPGYLCALVFKAFRLYCEGAEVRQLKIGVDSAGLITKEHYQL